MENGIRLYLAKNNNQVAGRRVDLIVKDDTGIAPDISKRIAQEMVVKDNVDILAGFGFTPSALAVSSVATEARKPMVVMNAASSVIPSKSPYIVRTSMSLPQTTAPVALWAAKSGIQKVFTLVADYGPGIDAETQFKRSFAASGGKIIGELRTPVKNTDFSPYLQKIKDEKPDAVFVFLPAGEQTILFLKGYAERGLSQVGIKLLATGDLTEESSLDSIGDTAIGIITSFHYAEGHKSSENKSFVDAFYKAYPKDRPNFLAVEAFDGMALIHEVLKKTGGDASAEKFIEAARGLKMNSPRGEFTIDPTTRDITQTIYIRKVEKIAGKLQNVEFDKLPDFRDPSKE